jgi:hypothetical protein
MTWRNHVQGARKAPGRWPIHRRGARQHVSEPMTPKRPHPREQRDVHVNDYYSLIARAVEGLDTSTGECRRALYERARNALVAQLRSNEPAPLEADITKESSPLKRRSAGWRPTRHVSREAGRERKRRSRGR